ncbi:MAG: peptidylprolyl isomerase [Pirellulaceae bacterium]|nr:peptidylprolyl isomerase [Pirellulaceae bacterium]
MFEVYELIREQNNATVYQTLWEAELKAREADAAGEPLPRVLIQTTKGDFEVELFENEAPNTVANFIALCEQGFFDKLPFHRVLRHFMAQGGDPARDGTGGPGYSIRTELNGKTDRNFFRGTLGMATAAMPDSGGSQFFICYLPRNSLNGKYVAFGRVVENMNIVGDLARINPEDKEAEEQVQEMPDEIIATKVLRKRKHPYKVEKILQMPPVQAPSPDAQQ